MHGNKAVDTTKVEEPAGTLHERISDDSHHQPDHDGEKKLAGNVYQDFADALRRRLRFARPDHAVSPLLPWLFIVILTLEFWLECQTVPTVALAHLNAGQHATFEIECSAQIRKILVPTCVEVAALPAADFWLIRFLLRHCLY